MDIKEFIQEEIKKLHKKTLLENRKAKIEKLLKEYNNYDYPAGADADSNAPWNQADESPKFEGFEIEENGDTLDTFYVNASGNNDYAHVESSLFTILNDLKSNEEIMQYFEKALMEKGDGNPPSPELHKRLTSVVGNWFESSADVQWDEYEAPEPDFNDID